MKIYQHKNGNWIIDFTYKNQRVRRVVGESRRNAEAVMIRIKNDILMNKYGIARPKKAILFETFAKDYLKLHSKQNKQSCSRDEYSLIPLKRFFKGKNLSDITVELIEKYKVKRREVVSPATVNRELACLKTMFSKAIEWEKVETNPVKKIKMYKEDNVKEWILTNDEIKRLIETASSHLKPILMIALNTGMRRNEILSLKWENVNMSKGYILIENSKSGKPRKIPMNLLVREAFRNIERVSEFVFYNSKTNNYIKDIKTAFKSACERAEIKELRLHDLRHTSATKMIEAGVDLVTVSKILGHSSIQMTMRYAHPTPENMQRAVNKLGEIFKQSDQYRISTSTRIDKLSTKMLNSIYN